MIFTKLDYLSLAGKYINYTNRIMKCTSNIYSCYFDAMDRPLVELSHKKVRLDIIEKSWHVG